MKTNKIIWITAIILAITLFQNLVSAFGTSYVFEQPLTMYPQQTKNIFVTLQNNNDQETITAKVSLIQDTEIVQLTDGLETFDVPYYTSVKVNFSVTAPKEAKAGDAYKAKLRFTPQASGAGGMGLVFMTGADIDVLIVEPPIEAGEELKELPSLRGVLAIIALAIIAVAIILIVLIRKKIRK